MGEKRLKKRRRVSSGQQSIANGTEYRKKKIENICPPQMGKEKRKK